MKSNFYQKHVFTVINIKISHVFPISIFINTYSKELYTFSQKVFFSGIKNLLYLTRFYKRNLQRFILETLLSLQIIFSNQAQMEKNKKALVTFTALSIIAEKDNEQIQAIRKIHDPAFQRWKPHINICFPFVDPDRFDEIYALLQEQFKDFKPFEINFKNLDFFPHGTVFLNPQTQKEEQIQEVYRRVIKVLPECKADRQFHPHMTVGKFDKKIVTKKAEELQQTWKQWRVNCDGLHIIRRDKDTPVQTAKFIKFGG